MSWLYDQKRPKKAGDVDKNAWGFLCAYCGNTFQNDQQQLDDHLDSPKYTMCKGVNDKFDKEKAIEKGIFITPQQREEMLNQERKPDPENDEVLRSRKRRGIEA